jgi:hypothetical protein
MKKFFLFLIPVLLFSCKGVDQYKSGIEDLSTKWNETTSKVENFSSMLDGDLSTYGELYKTLTVSEEITAKAKPELLSAFTATQADFASSLSGMANVKSELMGFLATWSEKASDLNSLKEGLAAGKLGEDTATKITDLNDLVTKGTDMLATWTDTYNNSKTGTENAASKMKEAFAMLTEMK